MALTDAFPGVGGVADTVDLRKDLAGLIVRDAAGVARAGVFPRHTNALVTARASMGVDVAAFEAALVRGGGPLFIANDGTVTVAIGAAPSSNSRYDVVYVKQNESGAPFSDASNGPVFGFVSGAAAASPSLSAALALVPVGGLPLASVLIPSTATTTQSAGVTVSQVFPYTTTAGGQVWVRNTTERDAANLPAGTWFRNLADGSAQCYDATDARWLIWDTRRQTWSPTIANLTVGNGVLNAWYERRGLLCRAHIDFKYGSTSAFAATATPNIPVPVAAKQIGGGMLSRVGDGWAADVSAGTHVLLTPTLGIDASGVQPYPITTGAANAGISGLNASIPFAWATGDYLTLDVEYEVA